jgi:hypothetical protein
MQELVTWLGYNCLLAAAAIGDLMKLTESHPMVTAATPAPMWTFALVVCITLATFLFGVSACAKNINDRRLALMSYAFGIVTFAMFPGRFGSLDAGQQELRLGF